MHLACRAVSSVCSSAEGELDAAFDLGALEEDESLSLYHLLPQFIHEVHPCTAGDEQCIYYPCNQERLEYALRVHDGILTDKSGSPLSQGEEQVAMFVVDSVGQVLMAANPQDSRLHHSSLVHGRPVAAAGLMTIRDGRILSISNESGHYQPPASSLQTVVRCLGSLGVGGLDKISLDIVRCEAYESGAAQLSQTGVRKRVHRGNSPAVLNLHHPRAATSPLPDEPDVPVELVAEQPLLRTSFRELPPGLSLRMLALRWSGRGMVFATLVWALYIHRVVYISAVLVPLFHTACGLVCLFACISFSDDSQDAYATPMQIRVCYLALVQILFQCAYRIWLIWAADTWDALLLIRAALVAVHFSQVLFATLGCRAKWFTAWGSLRFSLGFNACASLLTCAVLRPIIGQSANYPPGKVDLETALVTWFLQLCIGLWCTPRMRARAKELWTVCNLAHGIQLRTDAGHDHDAKEEQASICS